MQGHGGDSPSPPTVINPINASSDSILCAQCNGNQSIVLHLVSQHFEDFCEDENIINIGSGNVDEYRRQVEARYPLCAACQFAVRERLKQVEFRVRCSRISMAGKSVAARQAMSSRYSRKTVLAGTVELGSSFVFCRLDHAHYWIVVADAAIQVLLRKKTIFNLFMTATLTACKIWCRDRFYMSPLLFSILYLILCMLHYRFKNAKSHLVIQNLRETTPKENRNPNSIAPLSLSSLSLTPSIGKRTVDRNPFKLKKPPLKQNITTSVKLRPTILDHSGQSSGLEDLFNNSIRISDGHPLRHLHTITASTAGALFHIHQTLLSCALIMLRLYGGRDPSTNTPVTLFVFCVNFFLRPHWQDYFSSAWPRYIYTVLSALRMLWLGVIVSGGAGSVDYAIQVPPVADLIVDVSLLLFR
jgi:hypothetical protein